MNKKTLKAEYQPGGSKRHELLEKAVKYISEREVSLQKHYGYKVDRQLYCNLIKKKMKVNQLR